jgi:hypothetical protein
MNRRMWNTLAARAKVQEENISLEAKCTRPVAANRRGLTLWLLRQSIHSGSLPFRFDRGRRVHLLGKDNRQAPLTAISTLAKLCSYVASDPAVGRNSGSSNRCSLEER